jgi:SPP1 family predicted phage head-tail adaptor
VITTQVAVNRFNHKIYFGTVKSVANDYSGGYDQQFVTQLTLRYATYQRTQTQQYALLGTELEDTTVIVVRRGMVTDKSLTAVFPGSTSQYDIVTISRDAAGLPVGYDLITLKQQKGVKR